jgi:hypothetical protein
MEEDKVLEVRMYFFVPYNISGRQMGIQAGHAALRYARKFAAEYPEVWDFVDNHETFIILNGGTTNDERDFEDKAIGTMNQYADMLIDNDIRFSYFQEPDLNHALSALCFLCDERVFNKKDYPNFVDWLINKYGITDDALAVVKLRTDSMEILMTERADDYKEWVRLMGGVKNVFLRELTEGKKLA